MVHRIDLALTLLREASKIGEGMQYLENPRQIGIESRKALQKIIRAQTEFMEFCVNEFKIDEERIKKIEKYETRVQNLRRIGEN